MGKDAGGGEKGSIFGMVFAPAHSLAIPDNFQFYVPGRPPRSSPKLEMGETGSKKDPRVYGVKPGGFPGASFSLPSFK